MLPTLVCVLTVQASAYSVFDRAAAAIAKLQSASVSITANGSMGRDAVNEQDQLAYSRPSRFLLRVTTPQTKQKAATRRIYHLSGGTFTALDEVANEYLRRTTDPKGALLDRLNLTGGDFGQHVSIILDASAFNSFMAPFRTMGNWKVTTTATSVDVVRGTATGLGKATIVFSFDRKSMLPRAIKINNPGSNVVWMYRYRTGAPKLGFSVPSSARRVSVFTERPAPPTFVDARAKAVVEASRRAYASLKSAQVTATFGRQRSQYWIGSGRAHERGAVLEWAYGKGVFTARHIPSGRYYQGKANREEIIDYVAALGGSMEPRLRAFVYGRNPVDQIFNGSMKVRISGSMKLRGVDTTIVDGRGEGVEVSASILGNSRLFSSISTTNLDNRGHVVGRSEAILQYSKVNQAIPLSNLTIKIPKGAKVGRLPVLKKHP